MFSLWTKLPNFSTAVADFKFHSAFVLIREISFERDSFKNKLFQDEYREICVNQQCQGKVFITWTHGKLTFFRLVEHFAIVGSSKEKSGSCADCDWADGKGWTSLWHLLEAAEGADYLPYGTGQWFNQLADHCAIVVFAIRKLDEADSQWDEFIVLQSSG